MTDRIAKMCEDVLDHDIYPEKTKAEYDRSDLFLPDELLNAKRCAEYVNAQKVTLVGERLFPGLFRYDGSCMGDHFTRMGHKYFDLIRREFYGKPYDNLCTFEWQHSAADYGKVIRTGIDGLLSEIAESKAAHTGDSEAQTFLSALEITANGILRWCEKMSAFCLEESEKQKNAGNTAYAGELEKSAKILQRVPKKPCESFREVIQTVIVVFHFLPDSIGTLDRYAYKYYINDLKNGVITREEAKEYLQELFVDICGYTPCKSAWAGDKGAECHFAIGGRTADGKDGYNELSQLIVESLMELPLNRPEISLRWTSDTPREVLRYCLDCERHDKHKRIAFVNDEPRIRSYMDNLGLSCKDAVSYTMVGCNEPAFQGGMFFGGNTVNIARCLDNTLTKRRADIEKAGSFEEFFTVFREELYRDLTEICAVSDGFNLARAKDNNVTSSLFIDGCIGSARSVTRGGGRLSLSGFECMGLVCVIDSLSIIKQFVFDEKRIPFTELLDALRADWKGYELLRARIFRDGKFFGNGEKLSDDVARLFSGTVYEYFYGKKPVENLYGYRYLLGNLTGYNPHYAWFGKLTGATPDGRAAGEPFMVGIGQSGRRDRNGVTSLLSSVAQWDEHGIWCGPSVTNVMIEGSVVKSDASFDKVVSLVEAYFRAGGLHIQLNYITTKELEDALAHPEEYRSLRVRVSGFSAYFVNLCPDIQKDVVARTAHEM